MEYYDHDIIVKGYKKGTERRISCHKLLINRFTPVGEPADLYEVKPYGGKKWINWKDIIREEEPK